MGRKARAAPSRTGRTGRPGRDGAGGTGGTPATRALALAGVPHGVHAFDADDRVRGGRAGARPAGGVSFGEEAARALGVDPGRVLKTLVVDVDGRPHVAVVPVERQLDLKALAAAVAGKRAGMMDPAAAQRMTGYVVGGISPLGQRTRLPTVLEEAVLALDRVFVSGGRRGLDVSLDPSDLVRVTGAVTAPISRA